MVRNDAISINSYRVDSTNTLFFSTFAEYLFGIVNVKILFLFFFEDV